MEGRLYVIPGSHPSMSARLMLEHKGIPYTRRDLIPVVSKGALRAAGFPGVTVPALKLDGEKVQGSLEISRALDRIKPEPPLFPSDPDRRAKVEEAEGWGDEELQGPVRRILWNAIKRDRSSLGTYAQGAKLGVPDRARGPDRRPGRRPLGPLQRGLGREREGGPGGAARAARPG